MCTLFTASLWPISMTNQNIVAAKVCGVLLIRSNMPGKEMQEMLTLTLPGPTAGVSGSLDSYCSLKPLCSGMGEVVPARTSPTLLPHPLALCCHYPVSKCPSASIVATGTVRVKNYTPLANK